MTDVKRYWIEPDWTPPELSKDYPDGAHIVLLAAHTRVLAEKDDVIAGLQRLVRNLNADVAWRSEVAAGLQRDNETLQRQVGEMQKDAERLDWLLTDGDRDQALRVQGNEINGYSVINMADGLVFLSRGHTSKRAAIDAALSATTPQGRDGG